MERNWTETAVCLEEGVRLSTGLLCSLDWSFSLCFFLACVLALVVTLAVYNADEIFRVAVNVIINGCNLSIRTSTKNYVVRTPIRDDALRLELAFSLRKCHT